ncbi:phage regulatory CII family protein [Maridesulfovibrio ferrireducens]|uniref:phage regulatory CII family protein n=1 Tax=Maridesulfovibrio ferrireducens TaxID=246191 RepID=UPI001A2436DA|nr:phage regulatory CII family protein [Maridesulfovibrio ferrireducens]MBI9109885.1 hypothetical protein [Maridesulfovibrio ferrireducens]
MDNKESLLPLDALDAFKLALELSDKSKQEISHEMGWQDYHTNRIFSPEHYYCSYEDLPKFCAVVGNNIVIEWLAVKAENYEQPLSVEEIDCTALLFRVGQIFGETSDVGTEVQAAIKDGKLEPSELRRIIKELTQLTDKAMKTIGEIRKAERDLTKMIKESA